MLQAAGFKVDLKILEPGDLYERVLKGEHHLLSTGMVTSQGIAMDDLILMYHSSNIGIDHPMELLRRTRRWTSSWMRPVTISTRRSGPKP